MFFPFVEFEGVPSTIYPLHYQVELHLVNSKKIHFQCFCSASKTTLSFLGFLAACHFFSRRSAGRVTFFRTKEKIPPKSFGGIGTDALCVFASLRALLFFHAKRRKGIARSLRLSAAGIVLASLLPGTFFSLAEKLKEPYIPFFKKEPSSYLKIKKPIRRGRSALSYKVTKLIPILKYGAGPSELSIPKGCSPKKPLKNSFPPPSSSASKE